MQETNARVPCHRRLEMEGSKRGSGRREELCQFSLYSVSHSSSSSTSTLVNAIQTTVEEEKD